MSASLHMNSEGLSRGAKLWTASALVLATLAMALALAGTFTCSDCDKEPAGGRRSIVPSLMGAASEAPEQAAAASAIADSATALRPIAALEKALFADGSLRGTEAPGWGVGRDQPLKPNRALRDRFDYYLLALSEASLPELTALVQGHALRDLGTTTAAAVMEVWGRYLKLQQHTYKVAAQLGDPMSMQAALQEHRQVRQGLLGVHWAAAFYADEEKQLAGDIDDALKGVTPKRNVDAELMAGPKPGADADALHRQRAEHFGPLAAQRLAGLDREYAEWDKRIEVARGRVQALKGAQELSETQRATTIQQVLDAAFPDPTERLRAGGLVGE